MEKRDIVLDTLAHKDSGRIPYVIFFQPAAASRLAEHYGVVSLDEVMDNAVEWINNAMGGGRLSELGLLKDGEYTDEWGVCWEGVGETRGQVKVPPIAGASLKGYRFPEAVPGEILRQMKRQADQAQHRYRVAKLGALWEQATFLRGMENLLVDLLLHPGFVHELLDGILDVLMKNLRFYCTELEFDCIWLSDDYGTQRSLLMSPVQWREFIRPRVARLCDAVHDSGHTFALHSDGAIGDIILDLVDMGVDLLNPLQPECVDVTRIKREYGDRLTIWGAYGSQRNLVFGTPRDVKREVNALCDVMGTGGGFILTPGLSIQSEVPIENAVAFIETAIERERGFDRGEQRNQNVRL